MPLNGELRRSGARLIESTRDRAGLPAVRAAGAEPAGPGCCGRRRPGQRRSRSRSGRCRADGFGRFVAASARRRSAIGTLRLADGRTVKGFLVEADAIAGARDISSFGGWRAYCAAQAKVPAA